MDVLDLEVSESAEVKHLSPTKVEALLKCPEQFRLRYLERIPEPESGYLLSGIAVHAALEYALKRSIAGFGLPKTTELDDVFIEKWKEESESRERKKGFVGWNWDQPEEETKEECRALIPFAYENILPSIRPKLIEETAKVTYDSSIGPFLVWGVLDLLEEDGVLSDWKTTRGKVSDNARKSWLQLGHYSEYAHGSLGGPEVTEARKIFLIRGPRPKMEVVKYRITPAMRAWFARTAAEAWKVVKSGSYVPNTGGWWCSEKWCPFYGPCYGSVIQS